MVRALLLDMDGVIRHWRGAGLRTAAARYDLDLVGLERVFYGSDEYKAAKRDRHALDGWLETLRRDLRRHYGRPGDDIFALWRSDRGDIDGETLALVREFRAHGSVGILSNSTALLFDDLVHHQIAGDFDFTIASCDQGVLKPDRQAFALAAARMAVAPEDVVYMDDQETHVSAARAAGFRADLFGTADDLRRALDGSASLFARQ